MNFLKHLVCVGLVASAVVISPLDSRAQSGPPPIPELMELLTGYLFQDTNFLSIWGDQPLSQTNLALVPTWDNYGLQVDSSDPAWLSYTFESDGYPNLFLTNATISCWLVPNWISSGLGGTGSGVWSRIIDVGQWTSNASYGWFSLFTDPAGCNLFFSAQSNNGLETNYLSAPIAWDGTTWHQIVLTYSPSSTCLYLDGALATNGPGISILPPPEALSNGFYVLSDQTGVQQFHGQADRLWIYGNQETDTNEIASDYAYYNAFANPPPHLGSFGDDSPSFPDGDYSGGTNGGSGPTANGIYSPPYGSNDFWLQILPIGTNAYNTDTNSVTLILWGTIADIDYQIQMTTNIQTSNVIWTPVSDVLGSEVTNFTATTVSMLGLPTVYFRALPATLDSDGDGLPDWWELKYSTSGFPLSPTNADTGNTGTPDGYKQDSAGDGYNNLQKYQMGVPPGTWVTPPAITGFNVTLNSGDTSATLTWNPSPGPVTGYEILRAISGSSFEVIATLSATNTSYVDTNSISVGQPLNVFASPGSQYEAEAIYGGGDSTPTQSGTLGLITDPTLAVNAVLTRGPYGRWQLAFSAIPANVQSIQVGWYDYDYWYDDWVGLAGTNLIMVSNLVNGCYIIPDDVITNYLAINGNYGGWSLSDGFFPYVQGIGTNGNLGPLVQAGVVSADAPYLMDGHSDLQNSLAFLLRGATLSQTYPNGNSVIPSYPSSPSSWLPLNANFIELGLFHSFYSDKDGYAVPYLQLDNTWPITLDFALAQWLYSTNSLPSWQIGGFSNPPDVLASNGVYQNGPYEIQQNTGDLSDVGVSVSTNNMTVSLMSGVNNFFGLAVGNGLCTGGCLPDSPTAYDPYTGFDYCLWVEHPQVVPGGSVTLSYGPLVNYYSQFQTPSLQTESYYFAPVNLPQPLVMGSTAPVQNYPLPLSADFPTNTKTPIIIGAVGQPMIIGGWAQQKITGDSASPVIYLGQYFVTNAYQIDTNGNITTNIMGIVSPYGEFLPTQPGPVALLTMPDIITGQQGTCIVQVVKLQLDVNHDGVMDTSWAGPDNTSSNAPFTFWVNNDCDYSSGPSDPGHDVNDPVHPDYNLTNIPSERDLEDWARLWICGLPTNCQVTLSWTNIQSGSPAINLVMPFETNGGTLYLTDNNISGEQAEGTGVFAQSYKFANVTASTPYTFTYTHITGNTTNCYLFEGAGIGNGELIMTITQGTNVLATASAFMNFVDIKTMYERAQITETNTAMLSNLTSQVLVQNPLLPDPSGDTNIIVLVHGINVDDWHWKNASETVFKRLYWAGYRGRFSTVKWPCNLLTPIPQPLTTAVFNLSELQGYKASTALISYLGQLRTRFPGYQLNIIAHSQGNSVVSEAIRQGASFDTYILTQGAMPDSAYDVNAPTNSYLASFEDYNITPEWQTMGYHGIYTNFSGRIVNFYNAYDKVLGYWVSDQELLKPSIYFDTSGYYYNGTNSYYDPLFGTGYLVTDPEESRAMVSRSRTLCIGQSGPASGHGVIQSAVDLNAQFGFNGSTVDEHSAQWTRPIQACLPYYLQITNSIAP